MRSSQFLHGLLAFALLPLQVRAQASEVRVLVLDALDGKPQANVEVEYFCGGPPLNSASTTVRTSDAGFAKLLNFCNDKQTIEISVFPPGKKEQCGGGAPITFNDVVSTGFVSKPDSAGNIWCPTKVSKTLKPVPGLVVIFVKKPTWWQSHIAG